MADHTRLSQCSKRISESGSWGTYNQCKRKGVVVFEGKPYCQQHHPPTVKAKGEAHWQASQEKWSKEARDKEERQHRIDCYPELLAALELLLDQETNLAGECGWCFQSPFGHCERASCPGVIARAAIAKASPQAQ